MKIPQWLINTFLPSTCESWFHKVSALLKEKVNEVKSNNNLLLNKND